MVRLFLGFVAAAALVYVGLHLMSQGRPAPASAAGAAQTIRTVSNDVRKIEAQNRAALERTVKNAEQ
jgi:hypothetical protein